MSKKIVKQFLSIIGICLLTTGYAFAEDGFCIDKELVKAGELYQHRENRDSLTSAVETYENILEQIPQGETSGASNRGRVLVALAKCCFKLASYHARSNK
ncbi:MAG: hypothetical protein HZB37_06055 [Planctomycetes bacterium]|nr:hypothetical protein [Planctomycetota bacterium]